MEHKQLVPPCPNHHLHGSKAIFYFEGVCHKDVESRRGDKGDAGKEALMQRKW